MKHGFLIGAAVVTLAVAASAQVSLRQFQVAGLRFEGNEELNEDVLLVNVVTRESPSWFWQFLYNITGEKLGAKPEYFDPLLFAADAVRLRQFYQDQGFFNATVDTSVEILLAAKEVRLAFRVREGKRSRIDTLVYRGLDGLPSILLEEVQENPLIQEGAPYIVENVENELRRVVGSFFNHGYVRVRVDTVIARRYASTNNVTVVFSFISNERYSFGSIEVQNDTTVAERVDHEIVLRHLDFVPGDFYSEAKKADSERNLNRLGVFEASRIEPMVANLSRESLSIPMRVFVRPRPFHELTPELGANDENSAFNLVTGIGYNNRNFFGGARNFSTRFRLSLQSIQDVNLSRVFSKTGFRDSSLVSTIELSSQVVQPYLFSNKVSLSISAAAILEKQKSYFAPIYRGRIGVTAQLARYTRGSVDFNLERVEPEGFNEKATIELTKKQLTPQFNSIITVTIQRDKRNDLFSPAEGFLNSLSVEESGFIPSTFGGLFGSKLPYSNYYKLSGVAQWYWDQGTDRRFVWAGRLRGGFAEIYRDTIQVPITRRFFAGGSESVRGWKSRELGAVRTPNEGGNALFEANLEGRWHLFRDAGRLWFINLPSISIVMFYDIGNVWSQAKWIRLNEMAMASGLGFRWDTIAGPIRIDFGLRVYDPFDKSGRPWITQRKFFHDTYGLVHFGIGHAF